MKTSKKRTLDEIIKKNHPSNKEVHLEVDDDEDEDLETTFEMPEWEKEFYDEDGNFIENKEDK